MSSVFLSHSHEDKSFARRLATDLRLAGHSVWIDEAEINVGDSLVAKIREGIDQVDFVAAIISRFSIDSPWVTRELDIASNREMQERRVVVLPLLIERVPLPGFLEGKFYADFTDQVRYTEMLDLLLRRLGPALPILPIAADEIAQLREELAQAQAVAAQHATAIRAHQQLALRGKSAKLVTAIEDANRKFPSHAPINTTYAFETGEFPITLDYVLWAIAKTERDGSHPLEILITLDNKWPEVEAMLEAYGELLSAAEL